MYMDLSLYICMYVCMYVCMYIYIYIYTYTHTTTNYTHKHIQAYFLASAGMETPALDRLGAVCSRNLSTEH